jgi:hypothetical protein
MDQETEARLRHHYGEPDDDDRPVIEFNEYGDHLTIYADGEVIYDNKSGVKNAIDALIYKGYLKARPKYFRDYRKLAEQTLPSESHYQRSVFRHIASNSGTLVMPNVKVFAAVDARDRYRRWHHWECDMLYVTKAGYATEYEIKVTKADFKADAKKTHKHAMFARLRAGEQIIAQVGYRTALKEMDPGLLAPSRFCYVVPEDMVDASQVPEYAGLAYVTERGFMRIVKRAPQIHKCKIAAKHVKGMQRSAYFRYLRQKFNWG